MSAESSRFSKQVAIEHQTKFNIGDADDHDIDPYRAQGRRRGCRRFVVIIMTRRTGNP
jgi:hypothetical protein